MSYVSPYTQRWVQSQLTEVGRETNSHSDRQGMGDVLASDSMIGAEAAASDGTWTVSMQAAVAGKECNETPHSRA